MPALLLTIRLLSTTFPSVTELESRIKLLQFERHDKVAVILD